VKCVRHIDDLVLQKAFQVFLVSLFVDIYVEYNHSQELLANIDGTLLASNESSVDTVR